MTSLDSQRLDDFVFGKMSETGLPGVSAAVIQDGRVVHQRGYGFRDIAAGFPVTPQTLFGVGSITKSFVALSMAKLVDAGKLEFHDPVIKFLPLPQKAFEGVEVHHLLSHSSGIPGLGYAEVLIYGTIGSYHIWLPISSFEDMSNFMDEVDDWVEARPGEKLLYLNEGYYLLGEIIARVSGLPSETYITQEVLRPLKMSRSFFSRRDIESDADRSTPYLIKDGKATASVMPYGCGAAGGLVSSTADLSNFVRMLIDGGEFESKRLVSRDSLRKMEEPYVKWPAPLSHDDSYGYGLHVTPDFYGHRMLGHGGSIEVFTADFRCTPDTGAGAIMLANGTGYEMSGLSTYAMAMLVGRDPLELPSIRAERLLEKVEGEYRSYRDTVLAEVRRRGGFLELSGDDIGQHIILAPQSEDEDGAAFFTISRGAKMEVNFRFNRYGVELLYERYRYRRAGPLRRNP
ncbi:MAG: serine hydrolase [Thaumarchaeota archaeon]|nr:serine hydrolase [Nitrososphaerota archaeon]